MKTKMFVENPEMSKFFDYLVDWYGPESRLYGHFFKSNPLNAYDIDMAISLWLIMCNVRDAEFEGDTVDREFTRDVMFIIKGIWKPDQVEWSDCMTRFFTPDGNFDPKSAMVEGARCRDRRRTGQSGGATVTLSPRLQA